MLVPSVYLSAVSGVYENTVDCVDLFLLQVRLQEAATLGTEGTTQAGRKRSHSGSCNRLDREETGPGVTGTLHFTYASGI